MNELLEKIHTIQQSLTQHTLAIGNQRDDFNNMQERIDMIEKAVGGHTREQVHMRVMECVHNPFVSTRVGDFSWDDCNGWTPVKRSVRKRLRGKTHSTQDEQDGATSPKR